MLNDELALAKLKGESIEGESKNYWVMINIHGSIIPLPEGMLAVLEEKDWTSLDVKTLLDKDNQ